MKPTTFPNGLYGITPDWDDTNKLINAISQAQQAGMTALQWRRKHGTPEDLIKQAAAIQELCHKLGLVFIVNDNLRIAQELAADGLHIGKDDGPISAARAILGSDKIIGRSCYNQLDLAAKAIEEGADYIAFGSVYPSLTKPNAPRVSLAQIKQGCQLAQQQTTKTIVVAIGGITPSNAQALIDVGVNSLAVIHTLFAADDIYQAAKGYTKLFSN